MSKLGNYKIYIHRERGHVYIPFFSGMSFSAVLNLHVDGFCFVPSKQDDMGKFGCRVTISTETGKRFAGINLNTGKVYFDTTLGLRKTLEKFLKSLRNMNPDITCTETEHSYVEICARFPWDKVQDAYKLLDIAKVNFRAKKVRWNKQGHDALHSDWLYLVKNLLFDKFTVNLKVYLCFTHSGKKYNKDLITDFDYQKLPKVEVQISDSKNIEVAKAEAVPIILAFLDSLDCCSCEMIEDDYELVTFIDNYQKGYQQIFLHLNKQNTKSNFIIFSKQPRERERAIMEFVAEKPRSIEEIRELFDVSENTIRTDLSRLEKEQMIYSRGRKGVGKMYAVRLQPLRYNRPLQSTPTKSVPLVMEKRHDFD